MDLLFIVQSHFSLPQFRSYMSLISFVAIVLLIVYIYTLTREFKEFANLIEDDFSDNKTFNKPRDELNNRDTDSDCAIIKLIVRRDHSKV